MRIALDGTPLLGPRTGIGWHTADLVVAMADQAPDDEFVIFPISWRTASHVELPSRPNISVLQRFAPAKPLWEFWDRVPFPPLEVLVKADVFHATNFLAPPTRRMATVVTVHDVGFRRFPELSIPRERAFIRLMPKCLRRANAVIVVSDFTRDELAEWLPDIADRIHVIPNGHHPRHIPSDVEPPQRPFALTLGTLNLRKNISLVFDAIALLQQRGVELDLVLAGAPTEAFDVDAEVARRGIASRVTTTGYADDVTISRLLAQATVLAFPSLYEGFGMPLIEAMDAGIPVVAAAAGATPETVGDAALLVPNDAEAFADALVKAAFDDSIREGLRAAGHRRAKAFSWDRAAATTLELYRSVC